MAEANSTLTDRREFFRINDTVLVEYTEIDENQIEALAKQIDNPLDANSPEKNQLYSLQTAFSHLTDQINQYDRNIARALRLLDDKMTIIAHMLNNDKSPQDGQNIVHANLSGGGIAFLSSTKVNSKTPLDIHIELRPSCTQIRTVAHVVSCDKLNDAPQETPYLLRLAFTHMSEIDRNLLVKHVLNRQAEDIRNNAQQSD